MCVRVRVSMCVCACVSQEVQSLQDVAGQFESGNEHEELRCVLAVVRHGDRTPKQKLKFKATQPALLALFDKHRNSKGDQAKLKSPIQLQEVGPAYTHTHTHIRTHSVCSCLYGLSVHITSTCMLLYAMVSAWVYPVVCVCVCVCAQFLAVVRVLCESIHAALADLHAGRTPTSADYPQLGNLKLVRVGLGLS